MAENESPAAQIQPPVADYTRSRVYTAVGVDRHNDVAPGSQPLGEIGVAFVARNNHVTRRTCAGERILDVDIEPSLAGALETTTGRVVAMQEDQYRIGSVVKICGTVDARPQLRCNLSLQRNQRIDGRRKLVFGAGRRKWAWRRGVRRRLAERDCSGGKHCGKNSHSEFCLLHRVLLGRLNIFIGRLVILVFEDLRLAPESIAIVSTVFKSDCYSAIWGDQFRSHGDEAD